MKMKNLREDFNKLELMLQREFLNIKTKLLYFHKNFKDLME